MAANHNDLISFDDNSNGNGGGHSNTFPRTAAASAASKSIGEPNLQRVIQSELEYYRSTNNTKSSKNNSFTANQNSNSLSCNTTNNKKINNNLDSIFNSNNYASNQVFLDFKDSLIEEDDQPPPPLPPKKHGRRTRASAIEKSLSFSTHEKLDVDDEDMLSKSLPEDFFIFDPFQNLVRGSCMTDRQPAAQSINKSSETNPSNTLLPVFNLLGFEDNTRNLEATQITEVQNKQNGTKQFSTNGRHKSELTESRKVKTLSALDLQRFEDQQFDTSMDAVNIKSTTNKSPRLPVRPPLPSKNRFSCPPDISSVTGMSDKPKERNNPKNKSVNKNTNIYFTSSGLFQKTEERNEEAVAFSKSIAKLRNVYRHEDRKSNPGCIAAPLIRNKALLEETVSITVYFDPEFTDQPKVMNCKLSITPVDLIHRFFTECYNSNDSNNTDSTAKRVERSRSYELDIIAQQYVLKFAGATTCLAQQFPLCDYVTVQECIKYGYAVELVLARTNFVNFDFKRDAEDDAEDCQGSYFKYFFTEEPGHHRSNTASEISISEHGLLILLETYNNETARLIQDVDDLHKILYMPERLIQVVKAISKSLAQVELLTVQRGVQMLLSLKTFTVPNNNSNSSAISQLIKEHMNPMQFDRERFNFALQTLTKGVHSLIELYCKSFNTDFKIQDFKTDNAGERAKSRDNDGIYERIDPRTINDKFSVRVGAVYRIPSPWKQIYSEFRIEMGLYYGGQAQCRVINTQWVSACVGFFEHVQFNELLEFVLDVRSVPRETKVTFKLIGITSSSSSSLSSSSGQLKKNVIEVLGWISTNVYDHQGFLVSGSHLFGLIPPDAVAFNPVATCATDHIQNADTVILKTDFQVYHTEVLFPQPVLIAAPPLPRTHSQSSVSSSGSSSASTSTRRNRSLSEAEQKYMEKLLHKSSRLLTDGERTLVWSQRHVLCHMPHVLKHVLASCPSWDPINIQEVHLILSSWESLSPDEAIEFLQADFPDKIVREMAVLWLSAISDDDLVDYLPELVQAIKYEAYHDSALAQFLIKRSLSSPSVTHFLFWHLKYYTGDLQFSQRFQIVLSGLLSACGRRMRSELQQQDRLIVALTAVSRKVKSFKDANRQYMLVKELATLNGDGIAEELFPVRSPINPALKLAGILPEKSSYFASNTVPLRVCAANADRRGGRGEVDFIFKVGDDLRKDMVTLLMFRVMNKLWLSDGLDLKMMLYVVLPTGPMSGLLEMVPNSSTLREIHTQHGGVTGSFRDDLLLLWLQRHNTEETEYEAAVHNFTCSAAGYCVATYLLGIGDRHNDNIMLTKNGHLFHIDFSKFMGDVQKFGAISRDRVPFVFTPDMAYVINRGVTPTRNFQKFIDMCCRAFNIIRHNKHVLLNLLGLMCYSGIPYLSEKEDLLFVLNNLQLSLSDEEAAIYFTRLIESSLSSRSTQLNFFIHNIAQIKNMSESTLASPKSSPLFSFTDHAMHTCAEDGVLDSARIVDFQKRYRPEKYYVFVINILRTGDKQQPKFVFRRYEDFQELHAKLTYKFNPFTGILLPELPARILLGRSQIREVAHRRRYQLDQYLVSLLKVQDLAESDILATFLHSYIKDTEEAKRFIEYADLLADGPKSRIGGQIKLSFVYKDSQHSLHVTVMHCSKLVPGRVQGLTDAFVRIKIVPDTSNFFKRKTRVCRKTLDPTFNETLIFEAEWSLLRRRVMQVTVWDSSSLMEKEFLGGINFYLSTFDDDKDGVGAERTLASSWFPLTDIQVS